jgi:hypothetical protein
MIDTATENASVMPVKRGAPVACGAGPIGLAAPALLCGAVVSEPAEAAPRTRCYSDRELDEIGLRRADIPAIARARAAASGGLISRRRFAPGCSTSSRSRVDDVAQRQRARRPVRTVRQALARITAPRSRIVSSRT